MIKINCLIIDDEPLARKGIETYCNHFSFLNIVGLCKNALQASAFLESHTIDLIFLDINMPVVSGIDWLKKLENTPYVIFTTAYSEYALESFSFNVIDYLLKPISFDRFSKSILKAQDFLKQVERKKELFIKTGSTITKIKINEILFLEAMQNYVKIFLIDRNRIVHSTLKDLKGDLPEADFIQTHKSYVVAINKIDQLKDNIIHINNYKVPVSTRLTKKVQACLSV